VARIQIVVVIKRKFKEEQGKGEITGIGKFKNKKVNNPN